MIGYVTFGTDDLERAGAYYDVIAKQFDCGRIMDFDGFIVWGELGGGAAISVTKPFDGKPASVGNGTMVALQCKDTDHVQQVYDAAIEAGGSDEGAPGPRGDSGFYAGYFRDVDGNKLNAFCMTK